MLSLQVAEVRKMRSEVTELKKVVVTTKSKVDTLATQVCGVGLVFFGGFFSKLGDCTKTKNRESIICHILVCCLLSFPFLV